MTPEEMDRDGRKPLKDSHIWCENCSAIKPLIKDVDDSGDHPTTDLVCGQCALVIETIHHLEG